MTFQDTKEPLEDGLAELTYELELLFEQSNKDLSEVAGFFMRLIVQILVTSSFQLICNFIAHLNRANNFNPITGCPNR